MIYLSDRKMPIISKIKYFSHLSYWQKLRTPTMLSVDIGVDKSQHLYTVGRNVNPYNHLEEKCDSKTNKVEDVNTVTQ